MQNLRFSEGSGISCCLQANHFTCKVEFLFPMVFPCCSPFYALKMHFHQPFLPLVAELDKICNLNREVYDGVFCFIYLFILIIRNSHFTLHLLFFSPKAAAGVLSGDWWYCTSYRGKMWGCALHSRKLRIQLNKGTNCFNRQYDSIARIEVLQLSRKSWVRMKRNLSEDNFTEV